MAPTALAIRLLLLSTLGATAACSGPDPSAIEFKPRPTLQPVDAGRPSDGGNVDAGTGAVGPEPYASRPPPANGHRDGGAGGGITVLDKSLNCTDVGTCHGGSAPRFIAAGIVVSGAGLTTPVVDAEVWIRAASGERFKVNTDIDGSFWFKPTELGAPATLPGVAVAAVRTSTGKVAIMQGNAGGQGCTAGSCHSGPQGAVFATP